MARADVESLAASIADPNADTTAITRYYDDVTFELGRTTEIATQASLIESTGAVRYRLPSTAIKLIAVFYDDVELYKLGLDELAVQNPEWRYEHGNPFGYWIENEPIERFVVYPAPINPSGTVALKDLGASFVQDAISVVYTQDQANVLGWLELPVALEVASRELSMESNHKDLEAAALLRALASVLFKVVL